MLGPGANLNYYLFNGNVETIFTDGYTVYRMFDGEESTTR